MAVKTCIVSKIEVNYKVMQTMEILLSYGKIVNQRQQQLLLSVLVKVSFFATVRQACQRLYMEFGRKVHNLNMILYMWQMAMFG